MSNEGNIQKLAAENAQIYSDWLKQAIEVAAVIPAVQKSMQWSMLCAGTFGATPVGQNLPNTERLFNQLAVENSYLKKHQPKLPEVMTFMGTGSALAYSVGTEAASLLSGYAQNGTTEIKAWATQGLGQFAQPLQEDVFITVISSKLDRLYAGLTKEFQEAMQTTRTVLAGTSINSSAGIAMRNVLENLKGNILYLARQRSGNEKVSKWEDAARIIAKNGPASFEADQLVAKEVDWKQLQFDTTGLAKNNSKMSRSEVEATYFRWLGLLHSALTYIELYDGA
jgi:hypothetical protein